MHVYGEIHGSISLQQRLVGKLVTQEQISGTLTVPEFAEVEKYRGEYLIIPKTTEQILDTAQKYMEDDVTVTSVPYFETSNPTGETVYIASEV